MESATCLVTGATDGIGRATAAALARRGVSLVLHGRDPAKLDAVCAAIRAEVPDATLHPVLADFASLAAVADLADRVRAEFRDLTVLINNAGHVTDHWRASADGHELTIAVNHLAPALLTLGLLPTLRAGAPARIVNVSSTALGGGQLDFADLECRRGFDGWQAYANSKLMNALWSRELAVRLAGSGVVSNALCPGLIDTNFFHTNSLFAGGTYERLQPRMRSPAEGALVPLYLATDPGAGAVSGTFWIREGRNAVRELDLDLNDAMARRLWDVTRDLLRPWIAGLPGL